MAVRSGFMARTDRQPKKFLAEPVNTGIREAIHVIWDLNVPLMFQGANHECHSQFASSEAFQAFAQSQKQ